LCICGFAEVLSPQKIIRPANRKSANRKKYMVRQQQIHKFPLLRKVRKSQKIKSANLRICDLQILFENSLLICVGMNIFITWNPKLKHEFSL
jgi:hypothetical protein